MDSGKLPAKLADFLTTVDTLYMQAYTLKSARYVSKYLSRGCTQKLQSSVCSLNIRYFGDEKYRHTDWSREGAAVGESIVRKTVTFDKIKIAGKLSVSIAADYQEKWHIVETNSRYMVSRIESVD